MKKVGIITAMDEECEAIEDLMQDIERKEIYGTEFIVGKIENRECVLAKSGVGKVNAARTTQIMIDKFEIESIMNLGSAGAISEDLEIGDIIIGEHVVQHDFDITAFGHSKGYITGVGNFVECEGKLIYKFQKAIKELANENYKIKMGIVATGDIFCTEVEMKEKIRTKFDADVVDMECAAIAQVAYLDEIPFAVVRSISDTPNGENASTFEENLRLASRRCAEILKEYMKQE